MTRRSRLMATAATLAVCGLVSVAQGRTVKSPPTRSDGGTANFAITHSSKTLEYAAGDYSDKVLGSGAITYQLKLLPGSAGVFHVTSKKVVLYTGTGSLSGTATATITLASGSETITNGKLDLHKGSGSLKGGSLKATFTGTANLTANQFAFKYKGRLAT